MVGSGGLAFTNALTKGNGLIDKYYYYVNKVDDLTTKMIETTNSGGDNIGSYRGENVETAGRLNPAQIRKELSEAQAALRTVEKAMEQNEQAGSKDASQVAALVGQG